VSNAQIGLKSPTDSPEEPKFLCAESPATGLEAATACNSDDGNTDHQHDRRITRMEAKREVAVGLSAGRGAVAQRLEGKP
jgi:hypothetical protein